MLSEFHSHREDQNSNPVKKKLLEGLFSCTNAKGVSQQCLWKYFNQRLSVYVALIVGKPWLDITGKEKFLFTFAQTIV